MGRVIGLAVLLAASIALSGCGPSLADQARQLNDAGKHKEAIDLLLPVPGEDLSDKARAQLLTACSKFLGNAIRMQKDPELLNKPFDRKQLLLDTHVCKANEQHTQKYLAAVEPEIQATEEELRKILDLHGKGMLHQARSALEAASPMAPNNPAYPEIRKMVLEAGYREYLDKGVELLRRKKLKPAAKELDLALDWLDGKEARGGRLMIEAAEIARKKGKQREAYALLAEGCEGLPNIDWAEALRNELQRELVGESLDYARRFLRSARLEELAVAMRATVQAAKDAGKSPLAQEVEAAVQEARARVTQLLVAYLVRDCAHDPPALPGYCLWLVEQASCMGGLMPEVQHIGGIAARALDARANRKVALRLFDHVGLDGHLYAELDRMAAAALAAILPKSGVQYTPEVHEASLVVLLRLRRLDVRHLIRQRGNTSRFVERVDNVPNPAWQQLEVRRAQWNAACPAIYDVCQRAPAYCNVVARQACDRDASILREAYQRTPQTVQNTVHAQYVFATQDEAVDAAAQLELVVYDSLTGAVLHQAAKTGTAGAKSACNVGVRADDANGQKGSVCAMPDGVAIARGAYEKALAGVMAAGFPNVVQTPQHLLELARNAELAGDLIGSLGYGMAFLRVCPGCPEAEPLRQKIAAQSFPGQKCEHLTEGPIPEALPHIDAALGIEPRQGRHANRGVLDRAAVIGSEYQFAVKVQPQHGEIVVKDYLLVPNFPPPVPPMIPATRGGPVPPAEDPFLQCLNQCAQSYNQCSGPCARAAVTLDGAAAGQCLAGCVAPLPTCIQDCSRIAPGGMTAPPGATMPHGGEIPPGGGLAPIQP